jgi:hypothetical protein
MGLRRGLAATAALIFFAALAGCSASDPLVRADLALFAPSFQGDVGLSNSTVTDVDTIDIESDLDLGDTDYVPYVRLEGDLGPFNLAGSWFETSQSGTGVVTADFGNITAGSTVESDLDLTLVNGRFVWDFINTDLVHLGLGVAAEWVDFDLEAKEQTFGLSESVSVSQVLPLAAAHAAVGIPLPWIPLRLDVNAAGMSLHIEDVDGTVIDIEGLLRADFNHFGCFAGYRYILVQTDGVIDDQNFDGDIVLAGWLLGASVRF